MGNEPAKTRKFSEVRRPMTPERRAVIDALKREMATLEDEVNEAVQAAADRKGQSGRR